MNKIHALLTPVLLLVACSTSPEPELVPEPAGFTAVPIELVRYGTNNTVFHDGLPPDFIDVELPPELDVLGSMVAWNGNQTVAFVAEDGVAAAADSLRSALLSSGWHVIPDGRTLRLPEVFVGADDPRNAATGPPRLCHPTLGEVQIQVDEARDLLKLHRNGSRSRNDVMVCGQLPAPPADLATNELERLLPTLRVAEGRVLQSSSGGGLSERSAVARIRGTSQTLRRFADALADQMADQGWQRDARWSSRLAAGSTWTHPAEDGRQALATLDIRPADGGFDVDFHMQYLCEDCDPAETDFIGRPPIGIRGIPVRVPLNEVD